MTIVKIVLTGGPCAGKTTALSWISNHFTRLGWKVLVVSETATELMTSGLFPKDFKRPRAFQELLIRTQIRKENDIYESAKHLKNAEKVLIVCDRGIRDNRAYMSTRDFLSTLHRIGDEADKAISSYEGVFHLVTAADGAEEFYTLKNNQVRRESLEEAVILDRKTQNAWVGTEHFRIIKNTGSFEDKLRVLLQEISHLLGEPEPYEIERKYLIHRPNLNILRRMKEAKKVEILQTYLVSERGAEIRVRQRGEQGNYIFTQTIKRHTNNPLKRIEVEKRLSESEYLKLLMDADPVLHPIRKSRYCIIDRDNAEYLEIDIYPKSRKHAILEVELLSTETPVVIPDYLDVIQEVTYDERFSNFNIAQNAGKLPEV